MAATQPRTTLRWSAIMLLIVLAFNLLPANATAQQLPTVPEGAPNEVVALVQTTSGPELRVFQTESVQETRELLAELRATPEVLAADVNMRYELMALTGAPEAPTNVGANPGDKKITVSWDAPVDGDVSKVHYVLKNNLGDAVHDGQWAAVNASSQWVTSATIETLLINGHTYSLELSFIDNETAGTGGPHESTVTTLGSITPQAPANPANPTGVSATGGDASITVNWTIPTDPAVNKVRIEAYDSSARFITGDEITVYNDGWVLEGTMKNKIINGQTYDVRVTNLSSTGQESGTVAVSATPAAEQPPAVPTGLSAAASSGQAVLSWTNPADADLDTVKIYKNGVAVATVASVVPSATHSHTVTGLTNGVAANFTVSAVDDDGAESAQSAQVSVTPQSVSGPTGVSATGGNLKIDVEWDVPASSLTETVRVRVVDGTGAEVTKKDVDAYTTKWAEATTITDKLANGRTYTVQVSFLDGSGQASSVSSTTATTTAPETTPPAVPTGLAAASGDAQATLTWTNPSASDLNAVRVYKGGVALTPDVTGLTPGGAGSKVVTGLTNGVAVTFTVSALDANGNESAQSSSVSVTPAAGVPPTPTGLAAVAGDGQVQLTWSKVTDPDQAELITAYRLFVDGLEHATAPKPGESTFTVTGLTNGTSYTFQLQTLNKTTPSGYSSEVSATPRSATAPPCDPVTVEHDEDEVLAVLDSATVGDQTDKLGNGEKWLYTGEYSTIGTCSVDDGETVVVQVSGINAMRDYSQLRTWTFLFQSPEKGDVLKVGHYERAITYGENRDPDSGKGVAGLKVEVLETSGDAADAACADHFGEFEVLEFDFNKTTDKFNKLAIDFEDRCDDGFNPALNGKLRYQSSKTIDRSELPSNDPYRSAQWALTTLQAEEVWEKFESAGVETCIEPREAVEGKTGIPCSVIAVIDSGVDASNQDLEGVVLPGWIVDANGGATPEPVPTDPHGHGTAVASLIAATSDNGYGMAGLHRWARILSIRAEDIEHLSDAFVASAIFLAVDEGADVINLSLGGRGLDGSSLDDSGASVIRSAVDYAAGRGVVVVAAAGNHAGACATDGLTASEKAEAGCGNVYVAYPASYDGVVAVGASTRVDGRADFSAHNPFVDLVAPGAAVIGLGSIPGAVQTPDEEEAADGGAVDGDGSSETSRLAAVSTSDGTSLAAPYVAASAALTQMWWQSVQDKDQLSPWSLSTHLRLTALDLGDKGRDNEYGDGLVKPLAALGTIPFVESDIPGTPTVGVPDTITKEATGAAGAQVTYDVTVTRDGQAAPDPDIDAYCFPQSGETFEVGETAVACSAYDAEAGRTGFAAFTVEVLAAADGDTDGDGIADSQDTDAGAGSATPVPNVVNAGGQPTSNTTPVSLALAALLALAGTFKLRRGASQ